MKVLIAGGGTGGHLMPALALAEGFRAASPDIEPVLVGAERGVDAEILPQRPFRHYLIPAEPFYRSRWWRNLRLPLSALRVWRAVGRVLDHERPALVVGTGGYAAGPVVLRAARRRLPTALQEQNAVPGVAARWLARVVAQVHLGFPEAADHLRVRKGTEVYSFGNPVRPITRLEKSEARRRFGLAADRPVLLLVGGSQGARALNEALAAALESRGLEDFAVLWGSGPSHLARFERYARTGRVVIRGFFDSIDQAYAAADLAVARAGAMTIAELCAWGLPSVLVPLPTAAADHQTHNAQALAAAGAALHLPQSDLTPERLGNEVRDLVGAPDRLRAMGLLARARGNPEACQQIVSKMLTLVR